MTKRIACDFDGVIAKRYGIPRKEAAFLDLEPVEDAKDALRWMVDNGFEPYISTNRNESDWEYITLWLRTHYFPEMIVTNKKLRDTVLYIDDRAFRFTDWMDVCKFLG